MTSFARREEAAADTIRTEDEPAPAAARLDAPTFAHADQAASVLPMRLPDTDWLPHRLTICGPFDTVAAFALSAQGSGTIPWSLDWMALEEDLFHRLIAPPAPQTRSLGMQGARALARQLTEASVARHAAALARVGISRACPFDLHALVPVPPEILQRGPDDPKALAWLWVHWGTTDALRHVAVEPTPILRIPRPADTAEVRYSFWSADWTPWRIFAVLRERWPTLRLDIRPIYEVS